MTKIILSPLIGNVIEYYGFTVFALFTKEIGAAFFPNHDVFWQMLFAQLLFGSGFISRPIGSMVFGHFGDKLGRKSILSYTMIGMAVATCLIGITPTYSQIGFVAPIIILIMRLLQGFFVGGEGPGVAIYMLEKHPQNQSTFIGGIIISSIVFGSLLSGVVSFFIKTFFANSEITWRIPFLICGFLSLIGIYIRKSIPETEAFLDAKEKKLLLRLPILNVIRDHLKNMVLVASLGAITTAASYIIMAYFVSYFRAVMGLSDINAILLSIYSCFIYIVMLLFIGKVSAKYDLRKFSMTFAIFMSIFSIPIFLFISSHTLFSAIVGITIFAFITAGLCAPAYPYNYKLFDTEFRYSGVAVSYNLGICLFGGFTPAISSYLVKTTGLDYSPAFYLVVLSIFYLISEIIRDRKDYL